MLHQAAVFDEESRKTGSKIELARVNGNTQNDPRIVDCVVKTQKKSMKNGQKVYRSSSSSNKVEFAAFPGTVLGDCQDLLYELFEKNGKINPADRVNIQRVQMSAKAFADQMFINSLILNKQGKNKINMLPESNPLLSRRINNTRLSQTFDPALYADVLECKDPDRGSPGRPGNTLATQHSDKTVMLKPGLKNTKRVENVICHCSYIPPHRIMSNSKPRFLSFGKIKKRLKHSFRGENANRGPDGTGMNETVCKKLDFSGARSSPKECLDVMFEAKGHLSARLKSVRDAETADDEESCRTRRWILASPEHDLWRDQSWDCCCSVQMRFCPYGSSGCTSQMPNRRTKSCLNSTKPDSSTEVTSCDESDLVSENEAFTLPVDFIKLHDEQHESPVSVLEPIFSEGVNSPQTAQQKSMTGEVPIDTLSKYVRSVMEASCLNWDRLSEDTDQDMLCPSLFDQVEFPRGDCHFDPALLFDRINEVLLEIHSSSRFIVSQTASLRRKVVMSVPLEEVVVGKIMTQAEFYLLPETKGITTLDQIVANDMASCRPWLDVGHETEQIAVQISEGCLEECIQDMLAHQFLPHNNYNI